MKRILLLTTLLTSSFFYAQVRVGIESNNQYYLDDNKIKIDEKEAEDRFRSNTYVKLDYFKNKWEFGLQVESYYPKAIINYSPDLKDVNIGTIYARYNDIDNGVNITLGHFYEQFGSGLILRSWEDRALGVNNAIFGMNAKLRLANNLDLTALTGKQRVGMGFDFSDSYIMGTNLEFNAAGALNLEKTDLRFGASYVGRLDQKAEVEYQGVHDLTNVVSGRFNFGTGGFNLGGEYVHKQKDILVEIGDYMDGIFKDGNALLINLGYNEGNFGSSVNLRRMENMSFYSERSFTGNVYNKGVVNYVPALTKQYDFSLQNIYVYQAQPHLDFFQARKSGEIGGQYDLFYDFAEGSALGGKHGMHLAVNGSYWSGLKSTYDFNNNTVDNEFLKFGQKYYSDIAVEVRKNWTSSFQTITMYMNQYYNAPMLESKFEEIKTNIASFEGLYNFTETSSVRLQLQHMWAKTDKRDWAAGLLEFVPNSMFSIYVTDMYNYGNTHPESRVHYYSVGGSFSKGATRIAVNYGRQRGGLMCVGGVCRYVPESNGITLNLTTNF
ncbi:hypothetical protein H1R17_05560 [Flavobacterium sp. xlx-214]|uniref:DUF6029 family protein n=1 Tax=unclassified Flavobacterium TaxID=196869 RepID=UPI0013D7ABF1|nr:MULTISPECIES: DUF6029 family protein [unclassified Flavobacterium]MBA5793671.1 hypothetical protein [Flavobacterium sp. xlx-221]QMI84596.1 hypothetical protein H1R17_05560 [Flavobacterium sp. xlx-214]